MSQFAKSTGRIHGKFLYHASMIFFSYESGPQTNLVEETIDSLV